MQVVTLLVVNRPALVLGRVITLLRRRGHPLATMHTGRAVSPGYDVVSVVLNTSMDQAKLACRQLEKLPDVLSARVVADSDHRVQETALVTISPGDLNQITDCGLLGEYGARMLSHRGSTVRIEVSGPPDRVDSFLDHLKDFGITQLIRTGPISIPQDMTDEVPATTANLLR